MSIRRPVNAYDYNECRPYSSLNYLTPAEFAAGWRNGKYEEKPTDITN
ncbi:Transposase [Klebsiella pneumoniae]|nr:Transposase [Klebsiella pneumoniae]